MTPSSLGGQRCLSKPAFCQVQSGTAHYPQSLPSRSQPCKPHQTSSSSFQPAFFPCELIAASLRAFQGSAELSTLLLVLVLQHLSLPLGRGLFAKHSSLSPGFLVLSSPCLCCNNLLVLLIPHSDLHPGPWTGNFTTSLQFCLCNQEHWPRHQRRPSPYFLFPDFIIILSSATSST